MKTTQKRFDKSALRAESVTFEAGICSIIYDSLAHSRGKFWTLRKINQEISSFGRKLPYFGYVEERFLRKACHSCYSDASKLAFKAVSRLKRANREEYYYNKIQFSSEVAFDALDEAALRERTIRKAVNQVLNREEMSYKNQELYELLGSGSIFYLCSTHSGCAKDHLEYQGRVYVDENWEDEDLSDSDRAKVRAYIRNHRVKTVQEVCFNPPYLLTRPNCHHYLVPCSLEEILGSSAISLLKKKNLITGQVMQTKEMSYFRAYKERYELDSKLWKVMPNAKLAARIKNDKMLMKKWGNR